MGLYLQTPKNWKKAGNGFTLGRCRKDAKTGTGVRTERIPGNPAV